MKDIYIAGSYCSGKTWAAKQLALELTLPSFETDRIIIPLIEKYGKAINYPEYLAEAGLEAQQDLANGFQVMLGKSEGPMIINGFALNYREIRNLVRGITNRDYVLFNIVPGYERWKMLFDAKVREYPADMKPVFKTWGFYAEGLRRFEAPERSSERSSERSVVHQSDEDGFYYTVEDGRDLICQLGRYQIPELAVRKFKGLPLAGVSGRVLDLGCAEGYMGKFLLAQGAEEVIGVDKSWRFLEQARDKGNKVVLGNLNTIMLSDLGMFDYTLCLSVLHRVMDKEHLIAQIAACTRCEAIFELPVCLDKGLVTRRYDDIEGHTKAETQAWPPSQEILELWFGKYFKSFKLVGLSPLLYGDNSRRLVYRCRMSA